MAKVTSLGVSHRYIAQPLFWTFNRGLLAFFGLTVLVDQHSSVKVIDVDAYIIGKHTFESEVVNQSVHLLFLLHLVNEDILLALCKSAIAIDFNPVALVLILKTSNRCLHTHIFFTKFLHRLQQLLCNFFLKLHLFHRRFDAPVNEASQHFRKPSNKLTDKLPIRHSASIDSFGKSHEPLPCPCNARL